MISGLNLNATVDYVLKSDVLNPTVWKLGVIPSSLFAMLTESSGMTSIEKAYKILQISIKGWENFPVPYASVKEKILGREMEVVPIDILDKLDINQITELSIEAMRINGITDTERKN